MAHDKALVSVNGASLSKPLTLSAQPKTDTSRKGGDPKKPAIRFESPILRVAHPTSSFRRTRLTFKPVGGTQHNYDQAGYMFVWPHPDLPNPDAEHPGTTETGPFYVKVGIEVISGTPFATCLANNGQLDFSAIPLAPGTEGDEITYEVMRYNGSLLVLLVRKGDDGQETPIPVRMIDWCLQENTERPNMWVGVHACRPDWNDEASGPLEVQITHFEVEDEHGATQYA
ncbi:uncharacterized protein B0I36DRAFT_249965 [Microdochium trichocladiopsis]|uniref:Uncharacterized protein n=1 Tax=Microdochium trichocladiopsis TaxID=1682393 RepID=A0A9P8XZ82_9PEZI|nr:uncharacterized protein B0I36DRAFT_249965 [Microdochium trichocladiopsis]KAH7024780.1 hypothetical protein B0I36DRAFT_249965 [Microdochium trichocladiopsis]